jgi:hypothetical protein
MGMTICHTDEFVQSHFSDGNLIVRYINKMGTNGGGGAPDGAHPGLHSKPLDAAIG